MSDVIRNTLDVREKLLSSNLTEVAKATGLSRQTLYDIIRMGSEKRQKAVSTLQDYFDSLNEGGGSQGSN